MRNGILAALAALCFLPATAFGQANWDNRDASMTGDSGTNLRRFTSTQLCEGEFDAWVTGTNVSCGDGNSCTRDSKRGLNPAFTQTCCRNIYICLADGSQMSEEEILKLEAERDSLSEVFAPDQTVTYWGYAGGTNRSPNAGRTVSAKARLDACLFSTDVDAIDALGGTDADKYGYCAGSTYGCGSTMKNEYCRDNSAAVCVDRCACAYPNNGVDTCNSL